MRMTIGQRIATQRIDEYLNRVLPKLNCEKKCHGACGPILMSSAEEARISEACNGGMVRPRHDGLCNRLTHDGRCSIYSIRPAICRLWGLTETMACPNGCKPNRVLTDEEGYEILREVDRLSEE